MVSDSPSRASDSPFIAGDSSFITDAIWWLWGQAESFIPGVRLGGIYANKSGYHNTVQANRIGWPGDYSIKLPLDLVPPANVARALDLTMDNNQMLLRTRYLRDSALHPDDNRLAGLREFYGTLDGANVFGLIHNSETALWSPSTSDTSHLWHVHKSFFTKYCNNMDVMRAVASVLSGQSWADWSGSHGGETMAQRFVQCTDGSVWLCDLMTRRKMTSDRMANDIVFWSTNFGTPIPAGRLGPITPDFMDTFGVVIPSPGGGGGGGLIPHDHDLPAVTTGPASPIV